MTDDALAYTAIERLQRAYADASTRRAWPDFAALATPDAQFSFDTRGGDVFEFTGVDAFAEFAARMTAGFGFYEYVPLNFVVDIDPAGTARGRAYAFEIGELLESGELINVWGTYHDDYARVDGTWRFTRRRYSTLARRTGAGPLVSFPIPERPM